MRRPRPSFVLTCCLNAVAAVVVSAQDLPTTAFVDVSLVPMDRERVLSHQTVLVRGDRIMAIGPIGTVAMPAAARRVDGRGKFLLPGLADMHAHLPAPSTAVDSIARDTAATSMMFWAKNALFRYVAEGVTTVRDMWGRPATLALKAQAARGDILSPRIYAAVRPGPEGLGRFSAHPDSAVRLAKAAGYDLIKLWSAPAPAELDSLVAGARRVGLPIAGHPPHDDNLQAIRRGYASVEHLLGLFDEKDDSRLLAAATALKQAGVWVCPTLFHITNHIDHIDKTTAYRAVKVLHEAGVGLLLGNDPPWSGPIPGYFVYEELAALVEAGLTPYAALLTGTRNVAAYWGTLDSTGTIAVGKRADLVLLAGNPLEDVRHTARPAGVMLGGRWLSRAELDQILALLPEPS